MSGRVLEILLGVRRRKLRQDLRAAGGDVSSFAKSTSGKIRSSFRDAFGAVAGLGTVGGLAAIGKNVLDVDKKLTRLGIQAGKSRAEMMSFGSQLRDLSDDTGISTEALADAAAKFVSLTGEYAQAKAGAEVFAKTAAASGAQMEDVAAAAASLRNNLGITEVAGFNKGLSILLQQGKKGAVELRELAGLLPTIAPSFTAFGRKGTEGLAEMGAALQVVRGGFGSGSEAATGMNALMSKLVGNAHKFEKAGVKIFTKDPETGAQKLRRFADIIESISKSKLMNSKQKLQKAFGSNEARRAFSELRKNYSQFQDLIAQGMDSNAVDEDFARYMESSAGRMEKAWQRLHNTIARQITPERIQKLADALESLGRGVAFVVRHIKLMVAAFVTLKLAQWTARLHGLVTAMDALGDSTKKTTAAGAALGDKGTKSVGKFGRALKAVAGIEAAALGYQLGTILDKALGLSDALAGITPDHTGVASEFDPRGRADHKRKWAAQYRKDLRASQEIIAKLGINPEHLTPERLDTIKAHLVRTGVVSRDMALYNPKEAPQVLAQADRLEREAQAITELEKLKQSDIKFGRVSDAEKAAGGAIIDSVKNLSGRDLVHALGKSIAASGQRMQTEEMVMSLHAERVTGKGQDDPETKALLRALVSEMQQSRRETVAALNQQAQTNEYRAMLDSAGRAPAP